VNWLGKWREPGNKAEKRARGEAAISEGKADQKKKKKKKIRSEGKPSRKTKHKLKEGKGGGGFFFFFERRGEKKMIRLDVKVKHPPGKKLDRVPKGDPGRKFRMGWNWETPGHPRKPGKH